MRLLLIGEIFLSVPVFAQVDSIFAGVDADKENANAPKRDDSLVSQHFD